MLMLPGIISAIEGTYGERIWLNEFYDSLSYLVKTLGHFNEIYFAMVERLLIVVY